MTEPLYISGLVTWLSTHGYTPPEIEVFGCGRNTKSLVEEIVRRKAGGTIYEEVFAVFDRDEFPEEHFNTAIQYANAHGILPIWSNESFELWLFLHFQYCDSQLKRGQYCARLTDELGYKYDKADATLIARLMDDETVWQAIARAKKLATLNRQHRSYVNRNPATEMYCLVEKLFDRAGYKQDKLKK